MTEIKTIELPVFAGKKRFYKDKILRVTAKYDFIIKRNVSVIETQQKEYTILMPADLVIKKIKGVS